MTEMRLIIIYGCEVWPMTTSVAKTVVLRKQRKSDGRIK